MRWGDMGAYNHVKTQCISVFSKKLEQLACTGDSKVVWVDHQQGKSVELPDFIRQLLN